MTSRLRSLARGGLLSILAVSLGSCSRAFGIEVSGFGSNIHLEFLGDGLFHSSKRATCLKDLAVHELIGPTGKERLVWHIKASGPCVTLTGLDIGHVPSGFLEVTKLLPLVIGHRYQATAHAEQDYPDWGISGRWFVCQGSPEEAEWKNEHELRELPPSCIR